MRLFQNSGVYRSYRPRLAALTAGRATFAQAQRAFLDDRFGAAHFLKPVLDEDEDAFFANGDDEHTQRLWARENGLPETTTLEDILLAQIEAHRTEVFYNSDPMRYGDAFLARLPGSVRRTIAWRAAPSAGGAFLKHDVIVNNFPSLLEGYRAQGARAEYLAPAHDPVMDGYATEEGRNVDIVFVGTYSRHHRARAHMLEVIAGMRYRRAVTMYLDTSRYTRLAESPLGWIGPLRKDRRPADIRRVTKAPVFGRDLLAALGTAKIVVNGAIDMAGRDRGNMRVWEALGCGAALVTDTGVYPPGMIALDHFATYDRPDEVAKLVDRLLDDEAERQALARRGHAMIANDYSKQRQWQRFLDIAA